jgi:hypothetical protein
MRDPDWRPALAAAHDAALDWLEHRSERPVRPDVDYDAMYAALAEPMPQKGLPAEQVVAELAATLKHPGDRRRPRGRRYAAHAGDHEDPHAACHARRRQALGAPGRTRCGRLTRVVAVAEQLGA